MRLSQSIDQSQICGLRQREAQFPYETIGELELFSLHRIKHRMDSIEIMPKVKRLLSGYLIEANLEYRKQTRNDWNCITPDSLDVAVDSTKKYFVGATNKALENPEYNERKETLRSIWMSQIDQQDQSIRDWFVTNYDDLLYDQNGKIPWAVVQRLRGKLSMWAVEHTNPFKQPITELIDEVAPEFGINVRDYGSYEDIWKNMRDIKKK